MELLGRVEHGVIVPRGDAQLPEGVTVRIVYEPPTSNQPSKTPNGSTYRVQFPLVHSKHPGSVHLTHEMIGEIFDEEDFSPGR
jgi:hypothetical protein